ncbi:hypothetical protein BJ973_007604 [Actinoplanes tereljensis]|uniref:Uncharacterized protein n=1 Tax=Paractinoplanes tereljensis TaxID=571912 RepID=A0A919NS24_9ACTN|nr:hypothetical protein [Actinoplanes tereljensis]GIF24121.1 hypothetical protein Ate02nite_68510 [Actinoplanes tereljensis]
MTAPGNYHLLLALALGILISSGYAVGRIHQWHKDGQERDDAYRRGYEAASVSIFSTMSSENPGTQSSLRHRSRPVRGTVTMATSADRPMVYPRRAERVRAGI